MAFPQTPIMKSLASAKLFEKEPKHSAKNQSKLRNPSWWDSARIAAAASPDNGARLHARGRNHARTEMKELDRWAMVECEKFLGLDKPKRPNVPRLTVPDPAEPILHSPNHFERKYGRRAFVSPRRLDPITPSAAAIRCGTLASDALPLSARERANVQARAACWLRATAMVDAGAASGRCEAAAAV